MNAKTMKITERTAKDYASPPRMTYVYHCDAVTGECIKTEMLGGTEEEFKELEEYVSRQNKREWLRDITIFAIIFVPASIAGGKRLGNQAYNECKVLITGGWPNHPASKMWRGYEPALAIYALSLLKELKLRGRDYPKWFDFYNEILAPIRTQIHMPPWLGGAFLS
jgi:hypothetical protein